MPSVEQPPPMNGAFAPFLAQTGKWNGMWVYSNHKRSATVVVRVFLYSTRTRAALGVNGGSSSGSDEPL